jgi:chemotaxis protein methyltransferase CheR
MADTLLAQVSDFVAAHLGLDFPKKRWPELGHAMRAASEECGDHDLEQYVERFLSSTLNQHEIETLSNHLTVSETYFFREKRALEILQEHIVPDSICRQRSGDRQFRTWSAGCASGEEPYSIAIVLSKIPELKGWNPRILATDLNTWSLQRASEGIYREWSFRDTPQWVKSGYFGAIVDGRWAVVPSIKKMVTFAYLNLMEDTHPSLWNATNSMDVIFCRNVLMYFTPQARERAVDRFYRSLADGGWLVVSPAETSQTLFSKFATVNFEDATLYQKAGGRAALLPFAPRERDEVAVCVPPSGASTGNRQRIQNPPAQEKHGSSSHCDEPTTAITQPEYYVEAVDLCQKARYQAAEATIVKRLSEQQNDEQAMLLLARVYANQGKLGEALRWCEKAIATDKMDAKAHYLRATILQEQGSLEQAALSLRRALYADPQFALAHFALGTLALRRGKIEESARHFENALAVLAKHREEDILPDTEGVTVGSIREFVALHKDQAMNRLQAQVTAPHAPFAGGL